MFQKRIQRKNARGFTLIEVAIVLGVFALILGGIWMVVNLLYERARQHNANVEIQTIVNNIRQVYGRIGTFSNTSVTNKTLTFDQQNIFPTEMKVNPGTADGKINSPWTSSSSGRVEVWGPYADSSGEATLFELHYFALPKKACIFMATQIPSLLTGLTQIHFSASSTCYGTDAGCQPLPLTPVTAAVECRQDNTSQSTGQNDIYYRLSIH